VALPGLAGMGSIRCRSVMVGTRPCQAVSATGTPTLSTAGRPSHAPCSDRIRKVAGGWSYGSARTRMYRVVAWEPQIRVGPTREERR
jgi:hypothetical protein